MAGMYLYCQNTDCGVYLGSLGGDHCNICGWVNPEPEDALDCSGEDEQRAQAQKGQA